MHVPVRTAPALGAALFVVLLAASGAQAAPITVNLRVEGSAKTLFEGPISTEGASLETASSGGAHPCDVKDNGANGGFGVSSGTPTTALHDAAIAQGLAFDATWSAEFNDFLVTAVGTDVNGGAPEYPSWGYAVNYTTAGVGGCQFQLAPGSEVLWAYNYFNLPHLLKLTGPASASVGAPIAVHVADGQTGAPIAGALVGEDVAGVTTTIPGSAPTDAAGDATVTLAHAGTVSLKATQVESVRSNGLAVCVHNGSDGTCGTTVPGVVVAKGGIVTSKGEPGVPPSVDIATAGGVKNGHRYRRGKGPRVLTGAVSVPAGGTLREVRIGLQRRNGRRCRVFSGARGAFVRARCGVARLFSVGSAQSFSYLLPAALPRGRYTYEVEAVDDSGRATGLVAGVSHVVFSVG
jgi:hypothetical protein